MITRKELMRELKIESVQTIRNWEAKGMPAIRLGRLIRYELNDVMGWMRSNK